MKRLFERIDNALFILRAQREAVNDDLQRFIRGRCFVDLVELAQGLIDESTMKTSLA